MYWLILLGVLGQIPDSPRLMEIRHSLNRIDDLSKAALKAKAKILSEEYKAGDNSTRKEKVKLGLEKFLSTDLNISLPFKTAEQAYIENLTEEVVPTTTVKPQSVQKLKSPKIKPILERGWFNTIYGRVWGWRDPNNPNIIRFNPNEQPRSNYIYQPQTIYQPQAMCPT